MTPMTRAKMWGLCLGLLAVVAGARADAVGDYKIILDRNPFGLRPPPPPPPVPTNSAPETPTNYKLSGITALFKPPRAMFVNQVPGKPTPEYVSLSEGQRQGSIEVLPGGIDVRGGKVRVKISGEERTMSFEKDGLKAAAGPPVMTAPGVPVPMGALNPVPATPGGSMAQPPVAYSGLQPSAYRPGASPTTPEMQAVSGVGINTARQVRIPMDGVPAQSSPPPAPHVDPVEQALKMEVNRVIDAPKVQRGDLPPLPPTDLTGR